MPYIVPDDLRDGGLLPFIKLKATGIGSVDDTALALAIAAAQIRVDRFTFDDFEPPTSDADETLYVSGYGSAFLTLPKRVRAITSVTLTDQDGNLTTVGSTYYRVHSTNTQTAGFVHGYADGLQQILSGYWPGAPWVVKVIGKFGWATTPYDVKKATAILVWAGYVTDIPPNVESVNSGGVTITRVDPDADSTGVLEADQLLQPFRRLSLVG